MPANFLFIKLLLYLAPKERWYTDLPLYFCLYVTNFLHFSQQPMIEDSWHFNTFFVKNVVWWDTFFNKQTSTSCLITTLFIFSLTFRTNVRQRIPLQIVKILVHCLFMHTIWLNSFLNKFDVNLLLDFAYFVYNSFTMCEVLSLVSIGSVSSCINKLNTTRH